MKRMRAVPVLAVLVAVAACSSASPTSTGEQTTGPSVAASTSSSAALTSATPSRSSAAEPLRYERSRNAARDISQALRASVRDRRPVLLDFGANWCPDCVVIGELYRSPRVSRILAAHYHLVLIDVGHYDHNLDLAARYVRLGTSGIPALVLLRPTGRIAYASNNGAFRNARTMTAPQLAAFLTKWSTTR